MQAAEKRRERMVDDDEVYSPELAWYLQSRDAACGVRSSLGGQIEAIGRGGGGGVPTSDLYNESQSDLRSSPKPGSRGRFFRDRVMLSRWKLLDRKTQEVLVAHYVLSETESADPEHEWRPGDHPPWLRYSADYSTVRYGVELTPRTKFPKGVDARLSQLAGVAMYLLASDPLEKARVLKACEKGNDKALAGIKRRAESAIRSAHRAYYAVVAKEDDPPPRSAIVLDAPPVEELAGESFVDDMWHDADGVWRQHSRLAIAGFDRADYE